MTQESARPEQMELRTHKLTISIFSNISNFSTGNETDALLSEGPYQAVEVVLIILAAGFLSFVTTTGNILVMLSIKMNRNLQTINNYFLVSLACSDLATGIIAMNLYTVYIVIGFWPLGQIVCDLWLAQDYTVSSASVMNLLVISFDRYFCVTKPLSYPAKRTTRIAGMMMGAAWGIPFLLWAPVILFGQFIIGERIVKKGECYIEFLSNESITFITATISFYLPVTTMTFLYWQISRASKSRAKTSNHKQEKGNSFSRNGNHTSMPCDDECDRAQTAERSQNGGTGGVGEEEPSTPAHPEKNEIAVAPAGYEGNPTAHSLNAKKQQPQKKSSSSREKKVTRLTMTILVVFVVTWTPYNILKVLSTFCSTCFPSAVWIFSYWSCYINSALNPACYALCNVSFKKTFKQLLLCQHKDIRLGR